MTRPRKPPRKLPLNLPPESDRIYGGAGDDLIINANSNYDIKGGAGDDVIFAGNGARLEDGGLAGGGGDDIIFSENGGRDGIGNRIKGGEGDDLIIDGGQATQDQIFTGGAGQNQFALNINAKSAITITDFVATHDQIILEVSQAQKTAFNALANNEDKLTALGLRLAIDDTGTNIIRGDTIIIKLPNVQGLDINRDIQLRTKTDTIDGRVVFAREDVFGAGLTPEYLSIYQDQNIMFTDNTIRVDGTAGDDVILNPAGAWVRSIYGGRGNDKFVFDATKDDEYYGNIRDYTNTADEQDVIVIQVTAEQKAILDANATMTNKEKFTLIGLYLAHDDDLGVLLFDIVSFSIDIKLTLPGISNEDDVIFEFVAVEEMPIPEIVLVDENIYGDGGFARYLTDINRDSDDFSVSVDSIMSGEDIDASAFELREVGGIYQLWLAEGVALTAATHGVIVLDLKFTNKADDSFTTERLTIRVQDTAITQSTDTHPASDDVLGGSIGDDILIGGAGDDALYGWFGRDQLIGGAGDDVFFLDHQIGAGAGADDGDVVEDFGQGNDRLRLNYRGRNSEFTLLASSSIIALQSLFNIRWTHEHKSLDGIERTQDDADVKNTIIYHTRGTARADDDIVLMILEDYTSELTLDDFELITHGASEADDIIIGTHNHDTRHGRGGDDVVRGRRGNDAIYGGDGDDTIAGDAGGDFLAGEAGDDTLKGGSGDDVIIGGAGSDIIEGGTGDDILKGGTGFDRISGGAGDDRFILNVENPAGDINNVDAVSDFTRTPGNFDRIRVLIEGDALAITTIAELQEASGIYWVTAHRNLPDDADNDANTADIAFYHKRGTLADTSDDAFLMLLQDFDADLTLAHFELAQAVKAEASSQKLWTANKGALRFAIDQAIDATNQDASDLFELRDRGGNVELWLKDGQVLEQNHEIRLAITEAGTTNYLTIMVQLEQPPEGVDNIILYGDAGDEVLTGGTGADALYGGGGIDFLYGGDGIDGLYGGAGNDRLYGGRGDDATYGGDGNDIMHGDTGDDLLYGHDGDDLLYGGVGGDLLIGAAGADTLYGNDGRDRLYGEAGNDKLDGGAGDDLLYGEMGADTLYGGAGRDRLYARRAMINSLAGMAMICSMVRWAQTRFMAGAGRDRLYGGGAA